MSTMSKYRLISISQTYINYHLRGKAPRSFMFATWHSLIINPRPGKPKTIL